MARPVTLHYRRANADYAGWELWLWAGESSGVVAQARPGRLTYFGAVFRVDLAALFPAESGPIGVLPRLGDWVLSDGPDRHISAVLLASVARQDGPAHLFLVEGDGRVYESPADVMLDAVPRFLCARLPASGAAGDPWLLASNDAGVRAEFFPAGRRVRKRAHPGTGPVCIVDRARFCSDRVRITVCADPMMIAQEEIRYDAEWKAKDGSNFLTLPDGQFSASSTAARELIVQEAAFIAGDSTMRELEDGVTALPAAADASPPPKAVLKVYYQRLDGDSGGYNLQVSGTDSTQAPHVVAREERLYRGCAVFLVDLATVSGGIHPSALYLAPVVSTTGDTVSPSVPWTPDAGLSVILAESYETLLLPSQVDVSVQYHRFDASTDHESWELRVWTEAHDKWSAQNTTVRASFCLRPGVVLFDLTGVLCPHGARVHAQPVRIEMRDGEWRTNDAGEQYQEAASRAVTAKDVVRSWNCGKLPAAQVHFLQGDACVRETPPETAMVTERRFFRVCYMRFDPDSYEDWDLWTWEEIDGISTSVELPPVRRTVGGVEFVVDRASYGAGIDVRIIPRHGREKWDVKDEPVRLWDVAMLDMDGVVWETFGEGSEMPTFIVTQGSPWVLAALTDLRDKLSADVDDEGRVVLAAPVPLAWLNPAKELRSTDIDLGGLVTGKVECTTPTELLVSLVDNPLEDEDYLVENVSVYVPGFDPVRLRWRQHEDHDLYLYSGELGLSYSREGSVFRCFAPGADAVSVVLYREATGDKGRRVYPMRRIPNGCWKASVEKDLRGRFYKLLAEGKDKLLYPGVEIIDPYSRCNTSHVGRSLIFGKENTPIAARPNTSVAETIVYELHVRDATIDANSGVSSRGKYSGLTERGTRLVQNEKQAVPQTNANNLLEKLSTSLDHIVQMGVTAVQIMPVQDFDNDETDETAYRWGYMPVHFNSPDGWYASKVETSARITELKLLVDALHKANLKVIMDVVYNHTAEDGNEKNLEARFSFNGLAPRYYYRTCGNTPIAHTGDSTCGNQQPGKPTCGKCYSNGSGCGNEFRSESPMGRKFIIDSLCYWANEYKVDGFRFDLLGLIDVDTITLAAKTLHAIDPNIVVYGEPWVGGLTPIRMTDKGTQRGRGFSVFNNDFRDAIRGSPFGSEETFVMDGGRVDEVKRGLIGSIDDFCESPFETINYVECHDNYTLWDHMKFYIKSRQDNIVYSDNDLRRIHTLSAVIVFVSQGIPFIQMGQEMCRSKSGVENSYESPDKINMVRWERKLAEWRTVQYYHGLIELRRAHPEMFALGSADAIRGSVAFYEDLQLAVPDRCIAFRIKGNPDKLLEQLRRDNQYADVEDLREEAVKWEALVVILNPTPEHVSFKLPGHETDCVWMQIVDDMFAGVNKLQGPFVGSVTVPGRSAAVLRKASELEKEMSQVELRLRCVTDAYCVPGGDDGLTAYAVSLRRTRSEGEMRTHLQLMEARKAFEAAQAS